jgi:hypothetical protein
MVEMTLAFNKKTIVYVLGMTFLLSLLTISLPHLTANPGISTTVAGKIVTIINIFSTAFPESMADQLHESALSSPFAPTKRHLLPYPLFQPQLPQHHR